MLFRRRHFSGLKSIAIAFIVLTIPNQAFANDIVAIDSIRNSWKRISQRESSWERRVARFTGFLEGRFNIELPDVWEQRKGRGFEDYKELVFDREFNDSCRIRLVLDDECYSVLSYNDTSALIKWKSEVPIPISCTVLGPHVLYADVGMTSELVFLIGQIGETKFVRMLSRSDGKAVAHFTFSESSDGLEVLLAEPPIK